MRISLDWLSNYIDLADLTPQDISNRLTACGLEVEGLEKQGVDPAMLSQLLVGEILEVTQHPNADRLRLTKVNVGQNEALPIVCGAPNVAVGMKVVVAPVGAKLVTYGGDKIKIEKAKIRGEVSLGMLCGEDEIGLSSSHDGLLELPREPPAGASLYKVLATGSDYCIEIGLTPNRIDAASHYGVARDLSVLYERPVSLPSLDSFKEGGAALPLKLQVEEVDCVRYCGLAVENLTVAPSPEWLQRRLKTIGLSPINNVVDVTNYVLHECGQPLHAFDLDTWNGDALLVRRAKKDESFPALDGKTYKLTTDDLVIADEKGPTALAGVIGGGPSSVTEGTKRVLLECAYFHPTTVRKSSQRHAVQTDSSFRFERGADPNMVPYALRRAALLLTEIAGGTITSKVGEHYPAPVPNHTLSLDLAQVDKLAGYALAEARIEQLLTGLEIQITSKAARVWKLEVPAYRVDVTRPADIVEELLRLEGYEQLPQRGQAGTAFLAPKNPLPEIDLGDRIGPLLADRGFLEMVTNSLTKASHLKALPWMNDQTAVHILNRLSEDLGILRQTLIETGLDSVAYNLNRRQRNLRLFEVGKGYFKEAEGYSEQWQLALYLTGERTDATWRTKPEAQDLHELRGHLEALGAKLGLSLELKPTEAQGFQHGHEVLFDGTSVGTIGTLDPSLGDRFAIDAPVQIAWLNLHALAGIAPQPLRFRALSKFPEVRRDLALILDQSITYAELEALAKTTETGLLTAVNVFDVYQGKGIEPGKKSYALSFTLQDAEGTLTDTQIDAVMSRLMSAFETKLGAQIRR